MKGPQVRKFMNYLADQYQLITNQRLEIPVINLKLGLINQYYIILLIIGIVIIYYNFRTIFTRLYWC